MLFVLDTVRELIQDLGSRLMKPRIEARLRILAGVPGERP
jgi:hypothetical protein